MWHFRDKTKYHQYFSKVAHGDKLLAMPASKYHVVLSTEEQFALEKAARSNKRSSRERQRARILLASARGQSDAAVARAVGVCLNTVANVRRRFAAAARQPEGAGAQTVRRAVQQRRKARKLDGTAEAHLVALVCAGPPTGRKTWMMELLAGRLIQAGVVDAVTGETVRATLKKMRSSRG